MSISSQNTVRELLSEHPGAARVLEKMGIDYCCGGGKTLEAACASANVSFTHLLEEVAAAANVFPLDTGDWSSAPMQQLVAHIVDRHHAYVRSELPRLRALAAKVAGVHCARHPEMRTINQLVELLAQELEPHMMKEERILFPYICEMEAAADAGRPFPQPFFGTVENPVRAMVQEHENAGELLRQIRNSSVDFTLPADACGSFRALYDGLQEFERDLHQHIHLENNILFPRALEMEGTAAVR
jgi:regulator of cell morphogenesis and NO signaling